MNAIAKASVGASTVNDAADLEQKKKDLEKVSQQLTAVTKQAADLTEQIKTLEARAAEVRKATDAYLPIATAQQKELDEDRKLNGQKRMMALAGVKDQKEEIDKIVQVADAELATQAAKVEACQETVKKANQDLEAAKADAQTKQDNYAALNQTQKDTDLQLKQVSDLMSQAAKAEAAADVASMYFLLEEAAAVMKPLAIVSPDDYAVRVRSASADVAASKQAVATQKAQLDQKTKDLGDAQADLAAKKAARRATILAKLKDRKTTVVSATLISSGGLPPPSSSPEPAEAAATAP
jgi:hypothetical protein